MIIENDFQEGKRYYFLVKQEKHFTGMGNPWLITELSESDGLKTIKGMRQKDPHWMSVKHADFSHPFGGGKTGKSSRP